MIISKIEFALDKYLLAHIFKLITYWIRTHDGSQICYFVLILDSPYKNFFLGFDILSSAWHTEKKFLPWVCVIVPSWAFVLVTKRFLGLELIESWWRNIHMLLQLEVSNYHEQLQHVSRGHLCTDWLFPTILSYSWHGFFCLDQLLMFENSIRWPKTTFSNWIFFNM